MIMLSWTMDTVPTFVHHQRLLVGVVDHGVVELVFVFQVGDQTLQLVQDCDFALPSHCVDAEGLHLSGEEQLSVLQLVSRHVRDPAPYPLDGEVV